MTTMDTVSAAHKVSQAEKIVTVWSPWWAPYLGSVEFTYSVDQVESITGLSSLVFRVDLDFITRASLMEIAVALEFALQQSFRGMDTRCYNMKVDHPDADPTLIALAQSLEIVSDVDEHFSSLTQARWDELVSRSIDKSFAQSLDVSTPPSLFGRFRPQDLGFEPSLRAETYLGLFMQADEEAEQQWLDEQDNSSTPEPDQGGQDNLEDTTDESVHDEEDSDLTELKSSDTGNATDDNTGSVEQSDESDHEAERTTGDSSAGSSGDDSSGDDSSDTRSTTSENTSSEDGEGAGSSKGSTGQSSSSPSDITVNGAGATDAPETSETKGQDPSESVLPSLSDVKNTYSTDPLISNTGVPIEMSEEGGDKSVSDLIDDLDLSQLGEQPMTISHGPRYVPLSEIMRSKSENPHQMDIPQRGEEDLVGLDPEQQQDLKKEVAQKVSEAISIPTAPNPTKEFTAWSDRILHKPRVKWQKVLNKLITPAMARAQISGMSDLSYAKRNPNQTKNGPVMMGFITYPPEVTVLIDASPSMREHKSDIMSEFIGAVRKIFQSYGQPVTVAVADGKVRWAVQSVSPYKQTLSKVSQTWHGTSFDFGETIKKVATKGVQCAAGSYPAPDILVVFTDCEFHFPWPESRSVPANAGTIIIVSSSPYEKVKDIVPPWVRPGKTFLYAGS